MTLSWKNSQSHLGESVTGQESSLYTDTEGRLVVAKGEADREKWRGSLGSAEAGCYIWDNNRVLPWSAEKYVQYPVINHMEKGCVCMYIYTHMYAAAAAAAKSLQSCLTLCDPIDGSPPGSPVPGILQARTLEWVAIAFSNACIRAKLLPSCPTLCEPMDSSPPGSSVHRIL